MIRGTAAKQGKTGKKSSTAVNILIVLLCAALLAWGFSALISDVSRQIVSANIDTAKELVSHDRSNIRNSINVRWDAMEGAVRSVEQRHLNGTAELPEAAYLIQGCIPDADKAGFLDTEGTLWLSTGLALKNSAYAGMLSGQSGRFVTRLNTEIASFEATEEILLEAVPARFTVGGKDMAWLICQFPVSVLEADLKVGSYGENGYSSVIDAEGCYILNISGSHSFGAFDSLFDGLKNAAFDGCRDIDEVRAVTAAAADAVSFIYTLDGQKYLLTVSAFDFADWYIFNLVPMAVFDVQTNAIILRFVSLLGIITVILAAILYIIFRQKKEKDMAAHERHLREAEERRKLIEGITAAYNVAYVVNLAEDSFQLLRMDDTIIGHEQDFETFTQAKEFFFGLLLPVDRDRMRKKLDYAEIRRELAQKKSFDTEYRVPINGAMIWHDMNVTRVDENTVTVGFAVNDLEITKRHLENKRFSDYFALYEVDLDTETAKIVIDSPYYPVDRAGTAVPYQAAMTAFSETLKGEAGAFFARFADIGAVRKALASEDKYTYSYRSGNVDAKWVDLTVFVTLRHEDGSPAMFTLGFTYIDTFGAAKQELQRKIAEQKTELEKTLLMAETASKAKTDFLFSMSHDIRTPMNAITGFTAMAKKYIGDQAAVADYLEKIDASGKQLLSLVNNVLEMARIESGKMELEEKPVNVPQAFNATVTVLSEQAQVNGQEFVHALEEIRHAHVLADESKVSSVTMNILSNALKYTPEGGRISFRFREIAGRKPAYATYLLTVEDNGIGMSREFLGTLFDPFAREKNSTVSGIQGTGLGMAIVKRIVDLMGGEIAVRSEPGKGTRFDVTLDFRIDENASDEAENTQALRSVSLRNRKVLLVEDNEMNREIALDILEEEGLLTESVEDGSLAVEAMRDKGPDYYDFILMDIQMPVMNGYDATRAIRAMYPDENIPIIALSANAFAEDKAASLAAGMNDHVSKPIDVRELFTALAGCLA